MSAVLAWLCPCLEAADAPTHWAFQPLAWVEVPVVRQKSWVRNPIDSFILAGIENARLKPSLRASKEQLVRRVTFDLLGLPPTPDEIDAFVNDRAPDAWENLTDRLLASPHYGERWGRHWLDLARYAESDGFEHDALRPHAWRYRDYVIRSFNDDTPYERFVREQIAGDELWPGEPAALIATAFHLLGPDMVDSADQMQRRLNTLNDATDATASVFLGLTLGCARCHNHKFEPFTQRDYFSMQAFFAPATFQREWPVPTVSERATHDAAMTKYRAQTGGTQAQLDALEAPHREKLYEQRLAKLSEDAQLAHRTPREKRTMEQQGTVEETAPMLKFTEAELAKSFSREEQSRRRQLLDELKRIPKPAALPVTLALQNSNGPAPRTFVLARGDYNDPGEEVRPGFPSILRRGQPDELRPPPTDPPNLPPPVATGPRTQLAAWIGSPSNPLAARVMVNRIWQHHFGRGLVTTPSDFGTRGARPTHPELLDWLAQEFIARGWRVKAMHRLILTSAAYQQSSEAVRETLERDPENKFLARQNRVRLEGEAVRDSLLAIAGLLNRRAGGPSVSPPIASDITKTSRNWTASTDPADHARRSIYILARRNLRFPFLEVFDGPDSNLSCPERGRSTTAPQSLTLLNSDEVMNAARATAVRLLEEADSTHQRIERAFRLVLGRRPSAHELNMAREFLQSCSRRRAPAHGAKPEIDPSLHPPDAVADWAELCRALFNLNAFVYVD